MNYGIYIKYAFSLLVNIAIFVLTIYFQEINYFYFTNAFFSFVARIVYFVWCSLYILCCFVFSIRTSSASQIGKLGLMESSDNVDNKDVEVTLLHEGKKKNPFFGRKRPYNC